MYSSLTCSLHPFTVLKVRKQVLEKKVPRDVIHSNNAHGSGNNLLVSSSNYGGFRSLFRGAYVMYM